MNGLPEKVKVTISQEGGNLLLANDKVDQVEYLTEAAPVLLIRKDGRSVTTFLGDTNSIRDMLQELAKCECREACRQRKVMKDEQGDECQLKVTIPREDGRYHHHLLINATGPHDLEMICSLWKYGDMTEVKRIEGREYIDVARYLTKESLEGKPVGAQMWTRSRNLVLPTVESYFVPDSETVQPPPGAHVLERDEKLNEYGGFIYLKYRLPWDQDISHTSPQQNGKGKRSVEVRKIEVAEKKNGAQSYNGDRRVYPLSSL